VLPKIRRDAEGRVVGVSMPGDADYDDLSVTGRAAIS
jgi:hypothetical protein